MKRNKLQRNESIFSWNSVLLLISILIILTFFQTLYFFLNSSSIVIQAQSIVENKYIHTHTHTHTHTRAHTFIHIHKHRRHTQLLQYTIEKCLSGILLLIHSKIWHREGGKINYFSNFATDPCFPHIFLPFLQIWDCRTGGNPINKLS